ncbi:MAG: post-COAP-1 domain-containing protein [Acidobacteriota bacterium]
MTPTPTVTPTPGIASVTGGGWINSPPGAYASNPALTGKANFGFTISSRKGMVPTGNLQFHFKAAGFRFSSTAYTFLVVNGNQACFGGTGQVNGSGNYGFEVTVLDGGNGAGADRFRIRIWNLDAGNAVVYDTQPGAPDCSTPTTPLGGGNIVIHKK